MCTGARPRAPLKKSFSRGGGKSEEEEEEEEKKKKITLFAISENSRGHKRAVLEKNREVGFLLFGGGLYCLGGGFLTGQSTVG